MAKHPDRETDRIERGSRVQNTENHENRSGKGSVMKKAFGGKGGKKDTGKGGGKKR